MSLTTLLAHQFGFEILGLHLILTMKLDNAIISVVKNISYNLKYAHAHYILMFNSLRVSIVLYTYTYTELCANVSIQNIKTRLFDLFQHHIFHFTRHTYFLYSD